MTHASVRSSKTVRSQSTRPRDDQTGTPRAGGREQSSSTTRETTVLAYLRDSKGLHQLVMQLPAYRIRVVGASSLESLTDALRTQTPDVVLVELPASMSVSKTGRELAGVLSTIQMPVIAVLDEEQLQRGGFPTDAADFLTKPFSFVEAVVRIGKVIQGGPAEHDAQTKMAVGDIRLDAELYKVWIRGREVHFSYKEFELLRYLLINQRKVISRGTLLRDVWGYNFTGGQRTVDVHVRRLRAKLAASAECAIETVVNVGYKFVRLAGDGD